MKHVVHVDAALLEDAAEAAYLAHGEVRRSRPVSWGLLSEHARDQWRAAAMAVWERTLRSQVSSRGAWAPAPVRSVP